MWTDLLWAMSEGRPEGYHALLATDLREFALIYDSYNRDLKARLEEAKKMDKYGR